MSHTQEAFSATFAKVCPRCGATLFTDMNVCYGCLYDFSHTQPSDSGNLPPLQEEEEKRLEETHPTAPLPQAMVNTVHEQAASTPEPEEDDETDTTLDLSAAQKALREEEEQKKYYLRIHGDAFDTHVPIPEDGLDIGRAPDNDVVIHQRSVSRHHLHIVPAGEMLEVEDRHSTNPATLEGRPIKDSVQISVGDIVELGSIQLQPEEAVQ